MAAAYGLYTHIQGNRTRSVALLAGLFLLVYVLLFAGALAGEALSWDAPFPILLAHARLDFVKAAPFATLGTALWILIAYHFHQALIDAVTGGRSVIRAEAPKVYNLLENLCVSRGIAMPKLKLMESSALNAFATGLAPKQYAITVTSGLLGALDDDEIEAVLGHELTHIRNGDVRLLVIAVVIAGVISFFGELIFRVLFSGVRFGGGGGRRDEKSERSSGGAGLALLIAFALIALSWLLSVIIRFALSRSREFLADAGSVELTKNPDAMIRALRKIEGRGELRNSPSAIMEMCVDNPREGFDDLFATHPSIQSRVDALVKFAGGHDPGPLPDGASDVPRVEAGELPRGLVDGPGTEDAGGVTGETGPWGPHRGSAG